MSVLTNTQWLVLNATADDFEDLEQIYCSINFEFLSDVNGTSPTFSWRNANGRVALAEIAECIRDLVGKGLLVARMPDTGGQPDSQDLEYIWKAWFQLTPHARGLLDAQEE